MCNEKDVVTRLSELRLRVVEEAGAPCTEIETDLASVLDDVCDALGLDSQQRIGVLGLDAYQAIHQPPLARVEKDPHAELRRKVAQTFAGSKNVVIFGANGS